MAITLIAKRFDFINYFLFFFRKKSGANAITWYGEAIKN